MNKLNFTEGVDVRDHYLQVHFFKEIRNDESFHVPETYNITFFTECWAQNIFFTG